MKKLYVVFFTIMLNITNYAQSTEWIVFTNSDLGISETPIRTISEDKDGIIWIGTENNGILKYDKNIWSNYDTTNTPFSENFIWTSFVDTFNNKWFGTLGNSGGLIKYDNNTWMEYNLDEFGIEGSSVFSIASDKQNNLWLGTYWDGLVKFDRNTVWTIFNSNNSGLLQSQEEINCISIDNSNFLWYGSDAFGGGKFDMKSEWTYFTQAEGFDDVLLSVDIDATGSTWFGGSIQVSRIDSNDIIYHYSYDDGGRYFNIIADNGNILWLTSGIGGFLMLDYSEEETWTKIFPHGYGLDTIACIGLTKDHYGNLWVGYSNGYVGVYNPNGVVNVTSVFINNVSIPTEFLLKQNYPNPFNPATKIEYGIAEPILVSLKIYDIIGNEIKELVNKYQNAGNYRYTFDGSNLSSGIYLVRLNAGDFSEVRKMSLIK